MTSSELELVANDAQPDDRSHPAGPGLEHDEEIHMPPPSLGPIILGAGAAFFLLGLVAPWLLPIGVIVVLAGIWITANGPQLDMHANWFTFLSDRKFAMWAFLASEVMFFTALIGAFVAFKIENDGFEDIYHILNVPLATVGTSVLIVSSFAVVMALEGIQSDDRTVFRNWLIVTLALGAMFVGIQAIEWWELFDHGIDETTIFGTAFFTTTGFHGLHVIGGLVWLLLVLVKVQQGSFSSQDYLPVELFGLYWHFVDVVWIVLFTVIYLVH